RHRRRPRPPLSNLESAAGTDPDRYAPTSTPRRKESTMSFGQRNYDRTRPEIEFPGDTPPQELVIEDLAEGSGQAVQAGDRVSCHYLGVAWSTGAEFDASWNRGQPLDFQVGVGQVIKGWDDGLLGM